MQHGMQAGRSVASSRTNQAKGKNSTSGVPNLSRNLWSRRATMSLSRQPSLLQRVMSLGSLSRLPLEESEVNDDLIDGRWWADGSVLDYTRIQTINAANTEDLLRQDKVLHPAADGKSALLHARNLPSRQPPAQTRACRTQRVRTLLGGAESKTPTARVCALHPGARRRRWRPRRAKASRPRAHLRAPRACSPRARARRLLAPAASQYGQTPLHLAAACKAPALVVRPLVAANAQAAQMKDNVRPPPPPPLAPALGRGSRSARRCRSRVACAGGQPATPRCRDQQGAARGGPSDI